MFGLGKGNDRVVAAPTNGRVDGFSYLGDDSIYLDAACQSLRPQPVIDALQEYYTTYNACGGRVKYAWGQKVDTAIEETRAAVLRLLQCSDRDYVASFTLNTTYGINLLLAQLPAGRFQRVITSEIEHNSVFLPSISLAERLGVERLVLEREVSGELLYDPEQLQDAVVVVNAVSNIDGRSLGNIRELIRDTHSRGGIVIIDAAQAMAHSQDLVKDCGADAICFSAHKMYSASLGVVVARRDLLATLTPFIVGGGMVSAVRESSFDLVAEDPASRLEPGLQAFGEIIALRETLRWMEKLRPNGKSRHEYITGLSRQLHDGMQGIAGLSVLNTVPSPVVTVYSDKVDAHRLAIFLSAAGIMVRSGYFCCHYYLHEKKAMPPLLRFSLGLHNTPADIEKALATIKPIVGKA